MFVVVRQDTAAVYNTMIIISPRGLHWLNKYLYLSLTV